MFFRTSQYIAYLVKRPWLLHNYILILADFSGRTLFPLKLCVPNLKTAYNKSKSG